jgi:SAM-dependent methyltransferase
VGRAPGGGRTAPQYSAAVPTPLLAGVARRWTRLGVADPLWAALTDSGRGGRWNAVEFLNTGRREVDAVLALLTRRGVSPKPGTALDFGCGPGRLTAGLAAAGFGRAIGVDVSPTMLAKARELVDDERCEFVHDQSTDLATIPDESVDLVYSARVLQHLPPALAHGYIRHFVRVAVPGGLVVFQLPAGPVGPLAFWVRVLPAQLVDRLRAGMQMHGTPPAAVTRIVADAGGVTVSVEEDRSAGPRWRSHLYVVRADKLAGPVGVDRGDAPGADPAHPGRRGIIAPSGDPAGATPDGSQRPG